MLGDLWGRNPVSTAQPWGAVTAPCDAFCVCKGVSEGSPWTCRLASLHSRYLAWDSLPMAAVALGHHPFIPCELTQFGAVVVML